VDGNDVLAVLEATSSAVGRARAGQGPSLVECKTSRRSAHAVRDALPAEKRPADERAAWEARDPIAAFERLLLERGLLDAAGSAAIRERVERDLAEAVAFAEASPYPAPEEALDDIFAA